MMTVITTPPDYRDNLSVTEEDQCLLRNDSFETRQAREVA